MNFIYWNCCGGASSKIDTIKYLLIRYKPQIMFISEAEYNDHQTWVKFDDYNLISSNTIQYGCSRLIALIHHQSTFRKSKQIIPDDIELLIFENDLYKVCGAYRPFAKSTTIHPLLTLEN